MTTRIKRLFLTLPATLAIAVAGMANAGIIVGSYTATSANAFVVPVIVTNATQLESFSFDLSYDPASFVIDTACDPFSGPYCDFLTGPVTQGTFYSSVALFPSLFVPGFILTDLAGNQTGSLLGVNGAWQDPGPAPSGTGVLAFIQFNAVSGGSLTSPIVVVGQSPPSTSVPEPPTWMLLGIPALLLAWRRRAAPCRHSDNYEHWSRK